MTGFFAVVGVPAIDLELAQPRWRRAAPAKVLPVPIFEFAGSVNSAIYDALSVIASEARQSRASNSARPAGDCFVALSRSSQ